MDPTPVKRQKLDEICEEKSTEARLGTTSEIDDSEIPNIKQDVTAASDVSGNSEKRQIPDGYNTDLRLKERDVGITEYISHHKGFSGILKQRYSDFIVNEIALDGHVVKLLDFSIPKAESQETDSSSNVDCIPDEDKAKLQALLDSKNMAEAVYIKVSDSKEERTQIHKAIRTNYPGLESTTEEDGLQKLIKVTLKSAADQRRTRWPQGRGDYCKFVLSKENKDTMDALNLIAKLIRVKPNLFSYAGTKDRRAKTSQEVTAYRVTADVLKGVNKSLRNMAMGNFRYCQKPLHLGELRGNKFTIVLRQVTGTDDQIESALNSLAEMGFLNYYGMQRFGTTSVPTHHIGRALMCSRWQEAVEMILKPRNEDDAEMAECRRVWWETLDAKKALSLVCKHKCIEQSLLRGLVKMGPNNYAGALSMIPRNTRTMYVHSYQSFVWNTVVSRRIKQLGLRPVKGDLVQPKNTAAEDEIVPPLVMTDDNVENYGIGDVVLPLPGYDVTLPENEVAEWYKQMLQDDGLSLEQFRHKNKDYSLRGAYRKLIVKPENLQWSCSRYDDPTVPLVLGDLDILNGVSVQESPDDGKLKALRIEMSLPTSCYATMAVRDILKVDTSSAYQATLNPS
ncbi:pseudouridylate synthase 7 homolog [Liolophura sinensis]|uniref:pseudouridylate synthase 7 homolog n=1 Tax=Liolophura sinensis TaxID=3198878 RepID=UPI003158C9E6